MINLQPRRTTPPRPELMELLERCHGRMRQFMGLARQVVNAAPGTPAVEIADAARSIRRYFGIAFPLHGADEEESLIPRLRGLDPAVDAALARIEPDHRELDRTVATLVRLCERLESDPAALDAVRAELATTSAELDARLSDHLSHEEATFLPAIEKHLVPSQSAAILAEIRGRRSAGIEMP